MRGRRHLFALAAAVLAAAAGSVSACGNSGVDKTPTACLGGAETYRKALASAPGEVLLEGRTKISDCIVDGQPGGELSGTGQAIVLAATQLNAAARKDPTGPEATQLGYLVGAVQAGAGVTGGIHADLVRRLDAAARFAPGGEGLPAVLERAYDEGYAAGQLSG